MDLPANLVAKLRELPAQPGVYQMKDKRGRIIYIGKALSLKNRVPAYFQAGAEHDPRICHLVRHIVDVDWIIVQSEIDALMLESSLIRQFKPHYNTFLKDDKSYPYVKITNEPFPRVMLTRRYENDKAKYWGPLTGVREVRSAVRFIAGLFQLRTCKLELDGKQFFPKPCLDYHLKLCSGPCAQYINREDYRLLVGYAVDFFNGHYTRVVQELQRRMGEASEQREYENAARYRDLIAATQKSVARQRVIGKPGENLDVIGLARSKDKACVLVLPVRDGRMVGDRKFVLNCPLEESPDDDVLAGFLKLHYANPQNVPPELVLPYQPAEAALLAQWMGRLRRQAEDGSGGLSTVGIVGGTGGPRTADTEGIGKRKNGKGKRKDVTEDVAQDSVPADTAGTETRPTGNERPPHQESITLTVPSRGHKAELLAIAMRNAEERLHTVLLGEPDDFVITPGQKALAKHLGLTDIPRRIEGYDIANLQGKQATGAMVVFTGGRKASGEYRLFNIRLKDTPDDYAMLRETLRRRLARLLSDPAWSTTVDLLMLDGGKGQLSTAKAVLDELLDSPDYSSEQKESLSEIKLCSLAKQEELVYHYGDGCEVVELRLARTDPGLRLLVAVRDEAHRYGNAQHTRMREKVAQLGVLDTIPGLGPVKRTALLKHFGSVKRLREAELTDIAGVKGIGEHLAAHIRKCLDRDAGLETQKVELRREMRIKRDARKGRG
jgi:excinuclease ABC subunit C